ncbi:family 43 glycosylhydrolase [Rhodocytophaga rosea]|uniref:beta-fructofuranosidase n=1 Tax=Rhodocytophaga rosea TaxID=2704465 RepID=A0A6C0GRE3_9BACT|nr:family 43 glycosylhydrolase [Rhodocytophaga rosea]QHT70636.1 family 43 glycosylhydrolase [Rhodocytophaga rosea]
MLKEKVIVFFLIVCVQQAIGQFKVNYNPDVQPVNNMQYFVPKGNELFVGDCIPFSHNGTYYLYWLLDSAHHSALNGLGGHQWAVSTTKDLKTWKHYPVVLGIDEEWEKSICTGSVVHHNNKFYAFYATRLLVDGKVNEQLSYAISDDGIHFTKQKPNPFYTSAPGYSTRDFRDPKVFVDKEGVFHLFVSSRSNQSAIHHWDGSLVHMVSKDLKKWDIKPPILTGQRSVPECPDYFKWNNWYYLIYGDAGDTYYVKSKNPYGPWEQPDDQALVEDWSNVAKTAEFKNNRRIVAAWVPSRKENKDNTNEMFGGNAVFRELVQLPNGTLGTKFPPEMLPEKSSPVALKLMKDSLVQELSENSFSIHAPNGVGTAHFENIPVNGRITIEIEPTGTNEEFGLLLRSNENGSTGYNLSFSASHQTVKLHNSEINSVEGLDKPLKVDIIMKDGIIDVDVDNRRCIVNRLPEQKGNVLWFYAKHGNVKFKAIKVSPLTLTN